MPSLGRNIIANLIGGFWIGALTIIITPLQVKLLGIDAYGFLGFVMALQAAEDSSQLALDANKLGYNVGVRINIDVLNSQSQLYQTKRDLAQARYNVLLGTLKLRQAAGTLTQGFGMLGMQERVASLKGRFDWQSMPGQGVHIAIHLPLGSA